MQIILKRSTLQWTKKALPFFPPSSLMKVEKSPSVLHRRDSEIAGCTKPRPNWLGSVKMPSIKRVIFDSFDTRHFYRLVCLTNLFENEDNTAYKVLYKLYYI